MKIAAILWPIYFVPFYLYYKEQNILFPLVGSLIFASFSALFFADTLLEYFVFFLGVGLLLFFSMSMLLNTKEGLWYLLIGVLSTIVASLVIYSQRPNSPTTSGLTNTLYTSGSILWISIQVGLYSIIVYNIYTNGRR